MFNPSLTLVETLDDLIAFTEWIKRDRSVLAVDTETLDLDRKIGPVWWQPNFTRTVQFGDATAGFTLPLGWWGRIIKDTLESYDRPIVFHNFQFDLHALENAGIYLDESLVHDTMIMSQIVQPLRKRHGLKPLADEYVEKDVSMGDYILRRAMRENGWTYATVPLDYPGYWSYGALDTCITAVLFDKLAVLLKDYELEPVYELEMRVATMFRKVEKRGVELDILYTQKLRREWTTQMEVLLEKIQQYGVDNPNSNAQVELALRLEGWEPEEFTKTGQARLDEGILKGLTYPVVELILEYKKYRKWTKTYLEMFLLRLEGSRMHASIKTQEAITGRMSITKPPLQTLPRSAEIRTCVTVKEGHKLYAIDYSQIEYRLFAHFAQEKTIIDKYNADANADFHSSTAVAFFGENFTPEQRSLSKNLNFCILYGGGPKKLASMSGITEEEAQRFIENYKVTFPGVQGFMQTVSAIAKQRQFQEKAAYVRTPMGRKLFAPPGKNEGDDDRIYALVNSLCQGTAAEFFKQKGVAIDNAGLSQYIVLPVHDEFLFEIPDEVADTVVPQLQEIMEEYKQFSVPLLAEVSGPYDNWGEKYAAQKED